MAKLTITIADEILRWAKATEAILRLSAESRSGRGDRSWTRDELHDRQDASRQQRLPLL
jgi:hypothetical protein